MPVALSMEFAGESTAFYDEICTRINFPAEWPDGLLAHGSAEADGDMRVTDVWESRAKFDAFAQATLVPAMGDGGSMPEIVERELHSFYTAEPVTA